MLGCIDAGRVPVVIAMRHALLLVGLVTILSFRSACAAEPRSGDNPRPPAPPTQAEHLGDQIQRTMTLLATSTPQQRNRVRILFYGQSVTPGVWSKEVAVWLRKQYPHADLEIENRAIGGFSAPALIHTAESDLYPYYPDLLIFHVYGGDTSGELEEIIARTRRRTTAEILIRTPHFRWPKDLARDAAENAAARELNEANQRQAAKIRQIAAKYDCELRDVRVRWREYMKQMGSSPRICLATAYTLTRPATGCWQRWSSRIFATPGSPRRQPGTTWYVTSGHAIPTGNRAPTARWNSDSRATVWTFSRPHAQARPAAPKS